MSLSKLKTNFDLDLNNPTYQEERNYLLKVGEYRTPHPIFIDL